MPIFVEAGLDLDIHFGKNWIRAGSGYLFDFYNNIFLRVTEMSIGLDLEWAGSGLCRIF